MYFVPPPPLQPSRSAVPPLPVQPAHPRRGHLPVPVPIIARGGDDLGCSGAGGTGDMVRSGSNNISLTSLSSPLLPQMSLHSVSE